MRQNDYYWPHNVVVVALDLEVTGINRYRDRILQYGIFGCAADGGRIECSAVVDAEVPTGRDPKNIPGVTRQALRTAVPLRQGHLELLYFYLHDAVVICHNRHHDWTIIQTEFQRNHAVPPRPRLLCCTLDLCRFRLKVPPPHTLGALCQFFSIPLTVAHNALHDAQATFWLFMIVVNEYWDTWFVFQSVLRPLWKCRSRYWPPPTALSAPAYFQ